MFCTYESCRGARLTLHRNTVQDGTPILQLSVAYDVHEENLTLLPGVMVRRRFNLTYVEYFFLHARPAHSCDVTLVVTCLCPRAVMYRSRLMRWTRVAWSVFNLF